MKKRLNNLIKKVFVGILSATILASSAGVVSFLPEVAFAAFNKQINYQGKLTTNANVAVADGVYHMTFRLYTSATSATTTNIWEEDRSTAPGNRIQVTNGLFSAMLGSSTSLANINFNQTLYLGVEIGGSSGSASWDGEMTPRKILGAVPAAFVADTLQGFNASEFLRTDAINSTSTASTFITITQNGAGNILDLVGPSSANVFTVKSGGNIGVGTSTPYSKLSVWSSGLGTGQAFEITNSASSTIFKILDNGTVYSLGNFGIGSTSPFYKLSVEGSSSLGVEARANYFTATSTTATSTFSGGFSVGGGALQYDYSSGITSISNLEMGALNFDTDAGVISWVDMPISSTPSAGTIESYSAQIGGLSLLTIYSEANGSGSVKNMRVGIGTTSPYAMLSVAGQTVAQYFTATSTTLASTFPYASTTALTVSGANGLSLGNLYGPLQATNGLVSASSTLSIGYGGTGLSTAPDYGEILVGNALRGYTLTSTTTLGIASSQWTTLGSNIYYNTGNVGIGTTSPFYKLSVEGSSSLGVEARADYFTATTTATSTIPTLSVTGRLYDGSGTGGANGLILQSTGSATAWVGTSTLGLLGVKTATDTYVPYTGATADVNLNTTGHYLGASALYAGDPTGYALKLWYPGGEMNMDAVGDVFPMRFGQNGFNKYFFENGTGGASVSDGVSLVQINGVLSASSIITSATSTFANGIELTAGCFYMNGACVGGGTGTSQWTTLSSNIYYNTGNVGIGSTSPFYKLSVEGSSSLGVEARADYFSATSSVATSTFAGGLSVAGTSGLTVLQNGTVGIGTTSPSLALSINGGILTTASSSMMNGINLTSGCFSIAGVCVGGGTGTSQWTTLGSNIYYNTGNTGMGSTTPFYKLSVEGSSSLGVEARANYFTATSTTATSTFAGGLNVAGTSGLTVLQNGYVGVGTTSPSQMLTVGNNNQFTVSSGGALLAQSATIGSSSILPVVVSGTGSYSGQSPNGTYTFKGIDIYGNNYYQRGTDSWYVYYGYGSQMDGFWRIGTTLNLGSNIFYRSGTLPTPPFYSGWSNGAGASGVVNTTAGTSNQVVVDNSGSISMGGQLTVVGTGNSSFLNNLGIGSTSPFYKLSVEGSSSLGVEARADYFSATSSVATSTFSGGFEAKLLNITSTIATSTFANGIDLSNGCFSIAGVCVGGSTDSSQWTTLSSNIYYNTGNVGIGSTSPFYKLSVEGSSSLGNLALAGYMNATSSTATSTFSGGINVAGTSGLTVLQSGKIGVGTANPRVTLDILDASNAQLRLTQTDNSIYTDFKVAPTTGDLTVSLNPNATAKNIYMNQPGGTTGANLWVCQGDACPTSYLTLSNGGNIVTENSYYFGNGFRISNVDASTTAVYDTTNTIILQFDETP